MKRTILSLMVLFFAASAFAITTDLAVRFLDKANEAYENDNIENPFNVLTLEELKYLENNDYFRNQKII